MKAPTERDVKKLFALSLNQCAFPNCISPIFGMSNEMFGEICHIAAKNSDGPRYDPTQTVEERHSFSNLILLCRNHHKTVDDDPIRYSAEYLRQMKREHEQNGSIELDQHDARLARILLDAYLKQNGEGSFQQINQIAKGEHITQIVGDYHLHGVSPKQKILVTPPPGAVSPLELRQIHAWIDSLVENTTGMLRERAFGMWWKRFKNRFGVAKVEQLPAVQMENVAAWHREQTAILRRKLRTKAPDAWRTARYSAIHIGMKQLGVDKLTYYAAVASRLKMKKPFASLTQLTNRDLERVYTMVLRDAQGR